MKLLIVEDEAKIADYLRKGLAEEGYVIDVAANGIDGLHMASHGNYDLIVLDTMLPGIDGFGLLAALRQSKQTPVIMLTARHRIEDRVRGLKTGADDYLVKPFAFSELVARIEVLLRRAPETRLFLTHLCSHLQTCKLTWEGDVRLGPGSVSTCRPKSFNCCHFYCAAKERCCLALKLQNKFGT